MSSHQHRVNELRRVFDMSFAEEASSRLEQKRERFVYFTMLEERYAISALHLSGFAKAGEIVHLPARSPGLLGLSSVRGQLVPVFSLSTFLKLGRDTETPKWLAIAGHSDPVAFAVGELTGLDAADEQRDLPREAQPYVTAYCTRKELRYALIAVDRLYKDIAHTKNP